MENEEQQFNNVQSPNLADNQVASSDSEVSLKDWIISILIMGIPVVGIVMLFVWAFGKNENKSKANWAKANLIWLAVFAVIFIFTGASIIRAIMG